MTVTVDDIEIFITTHNRSNYLVEAIKSILNQTAGVKNITVLDNESPDNTEEITKSFEEKGVKYVKTFGFLGNFNKAREIVSKPYCMLFHDDDILHPKYIELALEMLNKYDNISMILTRYTEFKNNNIPAFRRRINKDYYLFTSQKEFAKHMYFIEGIAYATAIYRTQFFLMENLEYEKYSKLNDWPFMIKISNYGKTILLDDSNLFYVRRHPQQDTLTQINVPTINQIINWEKCFFDAMNLKNNPLSLLNYAFNSKVAEYLNNKYKYFISESDKKIHTIDDVYNLAYKRGIYPQPKRLPFLPRKYSKWLNKNLIIKHLIINNKISKINKYRSFNELTTYIKRHPLFMTRKNFYKYLDKYLKLKFYKGKI